MKKVFALIALTGMMTLGVFNSYSQDSATATNVEPQTEQVEETKKETAPVQDEQSAMGEKDDATITQQIKKWFIDGDPTFMLFVFAALLFGLAFCIERIIYLNLSTTSTDKLLAKVESALQSGGVEAAKDVCRNTRGPVASIFYQGLDRADQGIDIVEKSVINYGGVQAGLMERNLSWIALFIAVAPMLGFMGTIIGMINAFDTINKTGKLDAIAISGDLKLALITTLGGLVVAIILQIFYNYIVSKIDGLVNEMEDASISLVDIMLKHNVTSLK